MRGFRLLTIAVALLAAWAGATAPAAAQAARVDRLDLVDFGVFQVQTGARDTAPGTATGWTTAGGPATLIDSTGRVPARLGVSFGVRFRLVGVRDSDAVRLNAVWRFPEPGLKNPGTGNVHRLQTTAIDVGGGMVRGSIYLFEEPWELVPGTWVVEIRDGDRKLLEQAFTVYKP